MKRFLAAFCVFIWLLPWVSVPCRAAAPAEIENAVLDASGAWVPYTSAIPGEIVACRSSVTLLGGQEYVLRGMLSAGLTFDSVIAVEQNGKAVNASYFTLLTRRLSSQAAFEVHLSASFADPVSTVVTVLYTVKLNDAAVTGEEGNAFGMEVVDAGGEERRGEDARLRTYAASVYRAVTIPDSEKQSNPLRAVCFSLFYDSALKNRVAFRDAGGGSYLACVADDCQHTRHDYLLNTPENGLVRLQGLSEGVYYLQETRTPSGYKTMANALEIVVGEDGSVAASGAPCAEGVLSLVEQRVTDSPKSKETSDMVSFYEKGCRVMAAAVAVLVLVKRFVL